jgi:hypothetical protein
VARESDYSVSTVPEPEWDALVRQFPLHTAFHSLSWLASVAEAYGLRLALLKASLHDRPVAAWPCLSMRKGLLRIVGSPLPGWSTPYLGPLLANGHALDVIKAMLQHPELRRSAYFACKVLAENGELDLRSLNFTSTMRLETYRLDLRRGEDELWANCRRECRNHVRKAEKCSVEIRAETDGSIVDDFWSMSLETFGKSGVKPTYNRELIDAIWRRCGSGGNLDVISAFHQGTRIATLFLLHNEHTMYYWGGASRLEFRHIPANNLLQWHAIRMARQRGRATYDFVGTYGKPGTFKASFGPAPVVIGAMWERSASRFLSSLKQQYERHMRRRQSIQRRTPVLSRLWSIPAAAASWFHAMLLGH